MKRTGFKWKPRKPLKRTAFKHKTVIPLKRTRLRVAGHSTSSEDKREIQSLLRQIVILRDKKCILYGKRCYHEYGQDGVVWQAEHLIERSNSATYADTRLVVLVCRNCHGWKHFKKSNHDQYDAWVKEKLSPERIRHWEQCKQDFGAHKVDWKLEIIALKQELKKLQNEITI